MGLLDQPQGHRHAVPDLGVHRRRDRADPVGPLPRRADDAGQSAARRQPSPVQHAGDRARPDHGVLLHHAGADRRVRQLVRAADDRRARHGLPAHEQHQLLAAGAGIPAAVQLAVRRRGRHRLDDLSAPVLGDRPSGHGGRHGDLQPAPRGRQLAARRDQLHHHDLQHARARHDHAQDAAVRVVDPGDRVPAAARDSRCSPARSRCC